MARYINPYTDFGFKKLFGEEGSKDQLKDFLNELLPPIHKIKELSFKQSEVLGEVEATRKAIFDIYCEAENGTKFIVEMQKAKIDFFNDRSIFYTTFPIKEQAEKGDWNFELKPVYCIAILDFKFDKAQPNEKINNLFQSNVQLKDQYCNVFYDKLAFIFIEMPRFTKNEDELETRFDKWSYFLKHLEDFNEIPDILNEVIFIECFRKAEIANYNQKEREQYDTSLKIYRDLKGVIDTSYNEGIEIGIEKGRIETEDRAIRKALKAGKLTPSEIAEMLDVTLERVLKLIEND
ncbi:MAG: Rpn family recombination-promoting nuclease/putative transposase [Leptospiraceae bacterium]|nr:Rpn family recombination-promoting nuclease/putative transposase [Leptospiraceae bacterium]